MKIRKFKVTQEIYNILASIKRENKLKNGDEVIHWLLNDRAILISELARLKEELAKKEKEIPFIPAEPIVETRTVEPPAEEAVTPPMVTGDIHDEIDNFLNKEVKKNEI